eukprot:g3751.t1
MRRCRPLVCLGLALVAGPYCFTQPLWQWLSERGGDGCVEGQKVNGLRGLAVNKPVKKGDVILKVPLKWTLADGCSPGAADAPVSAGPAWAKDLPWNVQLALGVLERRSDPEWATFLSTWPEALLLPKDLEEEELEEAQDEDFEVKAGGTFFWLEDRYEDLNTYVQTKNLIQDSQKRRLLVPLLDLGNHDSNPSASFEFLPSEQAVCLVALRGMEAKEPVTYSYGEHPNEHFLLYYGFVPTANPNDFLNVTFAKALSFLPGYDASLDLEEFGGVLLRQNAPEVSLLQVLHAVLREAGDDDATAQARVLSAVAQVCRGLEKEHPTTAEEDEAILKDRSGLAAGVAPLVEWRLSRKLLLRSLQKQMEDVASGIHTTDASWQWQRFPKLPRPQATIMAGDLPSPSSALPHSLLDDLNCDEDVEPAPGLPRPPRQTVDKPLSSDFLRNLTYDEWEWKTSAKDFKPSTDAGGTFSSSGSTFGGSHSQTGFSKSPLLGPSTGSSTTESPSLDPRSQSWSVPPSMVNDFSLGAWHQERVRQ